MSTTTAATDSPGATAGGVTAGGVTAGGAAAVGVWTDLVGQTAAVAILVDAARAAAAVGAPDPAGGGTGARANRSRMSQTWLVTGPPGSGRSTAGRAFAAALQCSAPVDTADGPVWGCGACTACRTVRAGTHPDVVVLASRALSLRVADVRALVRDAAMAPTTGRWLVVVVEDADRLTDEAADALLKSIEEPPPRTVWVLCAPTVQDVTPTIRSRARHLQLRTPPVPAVAAFLVERHGVDPELALTAARSAQGHIGRARALALDDGVRARHEAVLDVAGRLVDPAACVRAAADLVATANEDAAAATGAADERETARLRSQLGLDGGGRPDRHASAALRDLAEAQKVRAKRSGRDHLDRALIDLAAWFRDVLARQLGATGPATNAHRAPELAAAAAACAPEVTLRRIDAVLATRAAVAANVAPLLAVEAMALQILLADPARAAA